MTYKHLDKKRKNIDEGKIHYKMMDRHFILSGDEWDFWRASMPRDELNKTFANRILLSPCSDSDIHELTINQIIETVHEEIKSILYGLNLRGVVGIFTPQHKRLSVYKHKDIFRNISFSVFFQDELDYEKFKTHISKHGNDTMFTSSIKGSEIWRHAFTIDKGDIEGVSTK